MADYTYDARTGMYVLRDGRKLTKQEFVDYNAAKFGGAPKAKTTPVQTAGIDNIPIEVGEGPGAPSFKALSEAAGVVKGKIGKGVEIAKEATIAAPGEFYRGGAKSIFETPTLTEKKQLVSHTKPGTLGGTKVPPASKTPSGGKKGVDISKLPIVPQMSYATPSIPTIEEEQSSLSLLGLPQSKVAAPEPSLWDKTKGKVAGIASGLGKWAEDPKIARALMTAGLTTLAAEPRRIPYSNAEVLGKAGLAGIGAYDVEAAKEAAGREATRKAGLEAGEFGLKVSEASARAKEAGDRMKLLIEELERKKELAPLEKKKMMAEINAYEKGGGKVPPLSVFMVGEFDPQTGYRIGEKFDEELYNRFAEQYSWPRLGATAKKSETSKYLPVGGAS